MGTSREPDPALIRSIVAAMRWIPTIAAVVAVVGLLGPIPRAVQPVSDQSAPQWLHAVERHMPGAADEPAIEVGRWSSADLGRTLIQLRRRPLPARMLIEGALLHLDISLLVPIRATSPIFDAERGVVESSDGSMVGAGSPATHLEFGRALLDMLLPSPSHHQSGAQWYHAAAAHLGGKYDHANGLVHLARARRLFPRDAFVLFASGCLHEVLAAPQVQTVIETTRLSHRESFDVESAGLNLRQAERFFAQALENDTTFHEARVRLARVMSLQGRQQEALAELQKVPADLGDTVVAYLARLFAGRTEELLGRQVAARKSFERAAALFPSAQSPQLALSRLAIVRGEREAASSVLSVLAAPVENAARSDPWWTYHMGPGRSADALIADFRYRVASERLR